MTKSIPRILVILFIVFTNITIYPQCSEYLDIFGIKLKAQDISGNKSFNDLGLQNATTTFHNLTDDTATYLWRLGTLRLNKYNFQAGTIPLFDLSTNYHKEGYPLLDEIDFQFYKEKGFQIIELQNPRLNKDSLEYKNFKEGFYNLKSSEEMRHYLWDTAHYWTFRQLLMRSKYFINEQPIIFNQTVKEKFTANINLTLKADIKNLVKVSFAYRDSSQAKINLVTNALLERAMTRVFNIKGYYITAKFNQAYIDEIRYFIQDNPLDNKFKNGIDQFKVNLDQYLNDTDTSTLGLNTAVFAFRFRGKNTITKTEVDSITADISAVFHLDPTSALSLSTSVKIAFTKHLNSYFSNEFSKVWIIKFGTDDVLEKLKYYGKNRPHRLKNEKPYYPLKYCERKKLYGKTY
jgi:hypothetical protein